MEPIDNKPTEYDINLNNLCKVIHKDGTRLIIMDGKKQVAWCKADPRDKTQGTCKILNYDKIKSYNKPINDKYDFLDNILDDTGIPCVLDKHGSVDLLESYPSSKYNLGDYKDVSKINEKHLIMNDKNPAQRQNFFNADNDTKKVILDGYMIENINNFFKYILKTKKIDIDNVNKQKQLSDEIYETKIYNVYDYMQYIKDNPLILLLFTSFIISLLLLFTSFIYYLFIIKKK